MKTMSRLQKIAIFYSLLFFGVVGLNWMPGIHDEQGRMFGLFKLDPIDDALHLGSALWASLAGWHSARAAVFYFKWFGLAYFLDGLVGLVVGKGYLDLGVLSSEPAIADFGTRVAVNVPHLALGGSAMIIGFVLSRKWLEQSSAG